MTFTLIELLGVGFSFFVFGWVVGGFFRRPRKPHNPSDQFVKMPPVWKPTTTTTTEKPDPRYIEALRTMESKRQRCDCKRN